MLLLIVFAQRSTVALDILCLGIVCVVMRRTQSLKSTWDEFVFIWYVKSISLSNILISPHLDVSSLGIPCGRERFSSSFHPPPPPPTHELILRPILFYYTVGYIEVNVYMTVNSFHSWAVAYPILTFISLYNFLFFFQLVIAFIVVWLKTKTH